MLNDLTLRVVALQNYVIVNVDPIRDVLAIIQIHLKQNRIVCSTIV